MYEGVPPQLHQDPFHVDMSMGWACIYNNYKDAYCDHCDDGVHVILMRQKYDMLHCLCLCPYEGPKATRNNIAHRGQFWHFSHHDCSHRTQYVTWSPSLLASTPYAFQLSWLISSNPASKPSACKSSRFLATRQTSNMVTNMRGNNMVMLLPKHYHRITTTCGTPRR